MRRALRLTCGALVDYARTLHEGAEMLVGENVILVVRLAEAWGLMPRPLSTYPQYTTEGSST